MIMAMANGPLIYLDGGEGVFRTIDWPAEARIPCAGEIVMVRSDTYLVDRVQWELEQGSVPLAVTLYVAQ